MRRSPAHDGELFELFWENSSLNATNVRSFQRRIEQFSGQPAREPERSLPAAPIPLDRGPRRATRVFRRRRSERTFSDAPLGAKPFGHLLEVVAEHDQRRTFGAAGALYVCDLVCLCVNVDPALDGAAHFYDPSAHSLTPIKTIPELPAWDSLINFEREGQPQAIFVIGMHTRLLNAKYGERGARFALLEAGGLIQTIALQASSLDLAACVLGGGLDNEVTRLAGFAPQVQIAALMAIGRR